MKTLIATLAFTAAALCAGSALAQTRPQMPAPRMGPTPPPSAGGSLPVRPAESPELRRVEIVGNQSPEEGLRRGTTENGETRATISQSGGVIAAETSTPVNGIGGTGGGRFTFMPTGPRTTAPPTPGGESGSGNGETGATVNSSGGTIDILAWSWGRIDRVNTVQACTARRGEVVMHQGVRQCRLPATTRSEESNRP